MRQTMIIRYAAALIEQRAAQARFEEASGSDVPQPELSARTRASCDADDRADALAWELEGVEFEEARRIADEAIEADALAVKLGETERRAA